MQMNLDFVGEPNIYVYGGNFCESFSSSVDQPTAWHVSHPSSAADPCVSGWGRCKYIRTLPSINVDEENRYGAEHWIR